MNANDIWNQYQKGLSYLEKFNLLEQTTKNQSFYEGKQWGEVTQNELPHPVFNFIKSVVNYQTSQITTNDIAVHMNPFSLDGVITEECKILNNQVEKVIEKIKFKSKARTVIKDGNIDGGKFSYFYFDPDVETHQPIKGSIEMENIDNTNVIFGNPYSSDLQKQPYIIVCQLKDINVVKQDAKKLGLSEDDIDQIQPNTDFGFETSDADNLVTVLTRFERKMEKDESGNISYSVNCSVSTKDVMLRDEIKTGYTYYPLAQFNWETGKNTYVGTSPITSIIPNQVFVNKTFALAQMYATQNLFPKVIYDTNKVRKTLEGVTSIGVANLDLMGKLFDSIKTPDFSNQVLELIEITLSKTKDLMGANDAALGNVKPDNANAIIAAQQASAAPLETQRLGFFDYVEDCIRIIIDIMASDYGKRNVIASTKLVVNEFGEQDISDEERDSILEIDFSQLKTLAYDLNVEVGIGSYFNELTQINSLDNLFNKQIIPDAKTYLELLPNKYVTNKAKIIEVLDKKEKEAKEMAYQQLMMEQQAITQNQINSAANK